MILLPCDRKLLEAAEKGEQELERFLEIKFAAHWTSFGTNMFKYALDLLGSDPDQEGWLTYLPLHKKDRLIIGTGGYKGKPGIEGNVEIGYEIAPGYRNRGLATEMAKALVDNAFSFEKVKCVLAHTLKEGKASAKVLRRCGFASTGEFVDPEDGPVFRWELGRPGIGQ